MVGKPYKYAEAAETKQEGPILGTLIVAKVVYDHHLIRQSSEGISIGTMIDEHIFRTIQEGVMVSGVTMLFEGEESQRRIQDLYTEEKK